MSRKQNQKHSFFYFEKGRRADAAIHNPILAAGDNAAAQAVGRAVAKEIGLSEEDCDALFATAK